MDTYWQDTNGIVWFVQDGASPAVGWVEVTELDYLNWYGAQQVLIAENKASRADDACAARKQAYDDLKASAHTVDWPERLFTFLTGYTIGDC